MDSQLIIDVMKLTGKLETVDMVSCSATPLDPKTTLGSCFHNGSMGRTEYEVWVFAHTSEGDLVPLPCVGSRSSSNYAYTSSSYEEAPCLGEVLAGMEQPKGVVVVESDYDSWEGQEHTDETMVTYYPWITPDVGKIRRRVEDRLRKVDDPQMIIDIAIKLGVSLT